MNFSHTHLHITHKRLTLLFTLLVSGTVFIIGISFLFAQHITNIRSEKQWFQVEAQRIIGELERTDDFLENFFLNRLRVEERRNFPRFERESTNKISFFILSSQGEIIFKNLLESPNFSDLNFPKNKIERIRWQFIYQSDVSGARTFVAYNSFHDDILALLEDFVLFCVLLWAFSILFYYIGNRFVYRALRPVEDNFDDMKNFIHNAGHELKTPLAVMRGNLQIMKAEKKYDEALLDSSVRNVDTMNLLIEGLRELSEVWKNTSQDFLLLKDAVKKLLREYQEEAKKKNISLNFDEESQYSLRANESELHMLISNIISNALRYTPENWEINISIRKNILRISDTGVGISSEELEKIFDRFYRGSSARSEEWFGIGLSLVKKIADANAWKISVKSEVGKGTSFEIKF